MRNRKLVSNQLISQRLEQLGNHTQLNANQCPTLQANYRHLSFVESYLRVYSNSAALIYQPIPVDFQVTPIFSRQSPQDIL